MTNLSKYLRVVDIIFEVADARCPFTSRSRQVKQLIKDKRSLLILNKADLADPQTTADWVEFYAARSALFKINSDLLSLISCLTCLLRDVK
ncbi:MAG TPA: hypothetical protein GX520_02890, partial [Syntrophaceticus sp.]|nr:hypothetical protein [Syntrophaceticus sp.]